MRGGALADRDGGAAADLFGGLVHTELVEHDPAVVQRRPQQPVPGADADLSVRGRRVVEDGQRAGDLGERGVLLRGQHEAAPAQRVRVGPQQREAVAPGVREHLVEPRLRLGGQALGDQPRGRGRAQQARDQQRFAAALGLVEELVHLRDDLELAGVVGPLDHGGELARAPDEPGVGHLDQCGSPGRYRVGRLFGQRQPPGVVVRGTRQMVFPLLRRQDSNLNCQNQNLKCCRLHYGGLLLVRIATIGCRPRGGCVTRPSAGYTGPKYR